MWCAAVARRRMLSAGRAPTALSLLNRRGRHSWLGMLGPQFEPGTLCSPGPTLPLARASPYKNLVRYTLNGEGRLTTSCPPNR
jgi:hypothetical protein